MLRGETIHNKMGKATTPRLPATQGWSESLDTYIDTSLQAKRQSTHVQNRSRMPSIEDWELIDPQGHIYTYITNMGEPEMSHNEGHVEVAKEKTINISIHNLYSTVI